MNKSIEELRYYVCLFVCYLFVSFVWRHVNLLPIILSLTFLKHKTNNYIYAHKLLIESANKYILPDYTRLARHTQKNIFCNTHVHGRLLQCFHCRAVPLRLIMSLCFFQGTVFDDITKLGCVAVEKCSCMHNGKPYSPGKTISRQCKQW